MVRTSPPLVQASDVHHRAEEGDRGSGCLESACERPVVEDHRPFAQRRDSQDHSSPRGAAKSTISTTTGFRDGQAAKGIRWQSGLGKENHIGACAACRLAA
jgi:hypothetical protein